MQEDGGKLKKLQSVPNLRTQPTGWLEEKKKRQFQKSKLGFDVYHLTIYMVFTEYLYLFA